MIDKKAFIEALRDPNATEHCFPIFSKRELQRIGEAAGIDLPSRLRSDEMVSYLYDTAQSEKKLDTLIEAIIKQIPEGATPEYRKVATSLKATKERVVEVREKETVEAQYGPPTAKAPALKLNISLGRGEHRFLQALAAGMIKKQYADELFRDVQLEYEIRTPEGIEFTADVYAEVRKGIPIVAEAKPYIYDQGEAFKFLRLCNAVKPYLAYLLVSSEIGAGIRAILDHDTFTGRNMSGRERQGHVTVIDRTELARWFEELKPYIRYEPPDLAIEL